MSESLQIVGGGLVGALSAIFLAKRGYGVTLFERRQDMRVATISAGRSINLAVTSRGLKALAEAGLKEDVLKIAIPMKGRMLHAVDGTTTFVPYGQKAHEVIYSVSRGELNKLLLSKAEAYPNVTVHFEQRCTGYDPAAQQLQFHDEAKGRDHTVTATRVIGTDGSGSLLRKALEQYAPGFAQTEEMLDYGYKELVIPASATGGFAMEKEALHIWPRKNYMVIALPNIDGSFTVTLFYPHKGAESFETLTTPESVRAFFAQQFPDALALMPELAEVFFGNPTGVMVTVKSAPWHIADTLMLLGDASHAIVPFFGQGMNCGFEDVSAFGELLDAHKGDWQALFTKLEAARKPNSDAIADMALANFIEMRDTVADAKFQLKKQIGFALEARYPGQFIPKYAMVVFHPEIPYATAKALGAEQDVLLSALAADITDVAQLDWAKAEQLMAGYSGAKAA